MLVFDHLERSISKGHRMAMYDTVTGLMNRRAAEEFGFHLIQRAKQRGNPLVAIVIDCDNFKHINDRYGHAYGDKALRLVGKALLSNVRGSDIVCRIGGDEFLVMMMGADANWANHYLGKVRAHLAVLAENEPMAPGVSAGVAMLGRDGGTFEQLVSSADKRMFRNKNLARAYDRAVTQTAAVKSSV
jgi:diguanylate cyclase (GGDEF)-like protein